MGALLADSGFTSSQTILDGENGFYALIGVERLYPQILTENLGKNWVHDGVSYKMYPACRIIHPALDAFYELMQKNKLAPDEIKQIVCKLHPRAFGHIDKWPIDSIRDGLGFSFCFPMAFAMAAYDIPPGPDWHSVENVNGARIKKFAQRVRLVPDPGVLQAAYAEVGNEPKPVKKIVNRLEITTVDGRVYEAHKDYAKGDPWADNIRFTDTDLADKLKVYGKSALSPEQIEDLIGAIEELDQMENIQTLSALLVP
jgi:2-methylcitrate dehydratase PrpD